jgi:hypothetical protein
MVSPVPDAPADFAAALQGERPDFAFRSARSIAPQQLRIILLALGGGLVLVAILAFLAFTGRAGQVEINGRPVDLATDAGARMQTGLILGAAAAADVAGIAFLSRLAQRPGAWYAVAPRGLVESRRGRTVTHAWSAFEGKVTTSGRSVTLSRSPNPVTIPEAPDADLVREACRRRIEEARRSP